jgi:hypothetical protein
MKLYEHRGQPLASGSVFRERVVRSALLGLAMVVASLVIGMAGYAYFESEGWVDAFLSASMILSGMGPANAPHTAGGKIFSGIYAIFSGFAVLVIAGVMFAPVIHRILHRFHLAAEGDEARHIGERRRQ